MARAPVGKKTTSPTATKKKVAAPVKKATPTARTARAPKPAPVVATTLPVAMTGRASPAKAKDGDEPVFAYIRSLPRTASATAGASAAAASPATSSSRSAAARRSIPSRPQRRSAWARTRAAWILNQWKISTNGRWPLG